MNIFVLGATSAIVEHTVRNFAKEKAKIYAVGRNPEKLDAVMQNLRSLGAEVSGESIDLNLIEMHQSLIERAENYLGEFDIVLIGHGASVPQEESEKNISAAINVINTNYVSCISLLNSVSVKMKTNRRGTIAVITSVAGDRGRQSNFLYGSTKAGLDVYLSGLRNRLFDFGIKVITIKPGFIVTPMTVSMKKPIFHSEPKSVGKSIYKAIIRGKDIVYVPWYWMLIMFLIKIIPEPIFKRMKL